MKSLIVIVDTEGKVSKSSKYSGLHDFSGIFIGTATLNKNKKLINPIIFDNFSFVTFKSIPNQSIKDIKDVLYPQYDFLLECHSAEHLIFCGWSDYDRRMLGPIVDDLHNCFYIDLLQVARAACKSKIDRFSISELLSRYKSKKKQKHKAFTDTLFTIKILQCIMIEMDTGRISKVDSVSSNRSLKAFFKLPGIQKAIKEINYLPPKSTVCSLLPEFSLLSLSTSQIVAIEEVNYENYDIIIQDKSVYQVRSGWEDLQGSNYKNKGLYILTNSKFVLIKDQEKKVNILDSILEKKIAKKISSPKIKPVKPPENLPVL